ncbi:MAG: DUF1501 domain-containing protein [Armatimonadota bacterium]
MWTDPPFDRRTLLRRTGLGMGMVGLGALLAGESDAAQGDRPPGPHFAPKAKRVLHLFMNGGPSQVDTFDYKPALAKYAGQPIPGGNLQTERKTAGAFPSPFRFERRGKSGIPVSEIFHEVGGCIDDICVINSMRAEIPNHEPSLMLMNCGDAVQTRPSMGSWITYGLGSANRNLPSFVVLCPGGFPIKDAENWRSAFLPGAYQGTFVDTQHREVEKLVENIRSPHVSAGAQRRQLDLLGALNRVHGEAHPGDPRLEARIAAYELAYRMQAEASDAFDISKEPESVRAAYGDGTMGRTLLIARRLLERDVRFVQVWQGAGQPWDNHDDIEEHRRLASTIDRPIAALLRELKQSGLLDDTLVIWGGEFGRTPVVEVTGKSYGRDHNSYGFSMWMAGGGVKGGHVHGATDEFGFRAERDIVDVHDLHATILHLLGFDHKRLTWRYAGRDFRLTDVHGNLVKGILA